MSASTKRRQTRSQRADKRILKPFAGVDGEGGDIDGTHEYLLLRAGSKVLETGKPLTPWQCFDFLSGMRKDRIYVSFAFDYDVSMMLRHVPPTKVAKLFNRESRAVLDDDGKPTGRYYPVDVGQGMYQIDYMPHKEFRVRRRGQKTWTVINDVFTFFQSSFVTALRKWFADEPRLSASIEKIAEGKDMRNDFGEVTEYERDYNELECLMLEQLMEKFRDMCTALDVKPHKWQGPGNLVNAVFKREGLPEKQLQYVPDQVWFFANAAYCGGRFEAGTYGRVTGKVYQYDINSAYASSYRDLPCLIHGTWQPLRGALPADGDIYLADVSFHHREEMSYYTLPLRSSKGTLLFPRTGRGWYWSPELQHSKEHADITVYGGWKYVNHCDCRYFDWVYDLYDERDRVGKTSGVGKVLKTILATVYGKLAQSKGHPIYSNPIWAGIVVSTCRATLGRAALQVDKGSDVHMLATDGLFCSNPRDLPVGHAIGEWELTEHDDGMFIVQSGLYFAGTEKPKTRGVPLGRVMAMESEFRAEWARWLAQNDPHAPPPFLRVPLRCFISARLAHARHRTWQTGKWVNVAKTVRYEWNTKRVEPYISGETVRTMPVEGSPELVGAPPAWMVGGPVEFDEEMWDLDDQPDWGDCLTGDEYDDV